MTRAALIERAEELILDAEDKRDEVEATEPQRAYLAHAVIDDLVRAHVELTSGRFTKHREMKVAAYLTRALLMAEALRRPVC